MYKIESIYFTIFNIIDLQQFRQKGKTNILYITVLQYVL